MIGVIFNMGSNFKRLWPRQNGIYKITNRKTGRFYIGKSEGKLGFYGRWNSHRWELRKNIHRCSYLQRSYNKHGESCFTFEILEIKDYGEPLINLESEYIINLEAMSFQKGYNMVNKKTESPKFVRESHPNSRDFELLDPQGNLVKGRNLSKFCEDLGIKMKCMCKVIRGNLRSYKGFKSTNPEFNLVKKEYRLLSPEKELIVSDSMGKLAREIGVSSTSIENVFNGKSSNVKGYHLENPSQKNQKCLERFFKRKSLVLTKEIL